MFLLSDLWEPSVSFISSVLRANVSAFKDQPGPQHRHKSRDLCVRGRELAVLGAGGVQG